MLVAFALLAAWAQSLQAASISSVDVRSDRIVVRFDDSVQGASAFLLSEPRRIAVDVSGARANAGAGSEGDGIVTRTRQGQYDASTARVVFELAQPAIVERGTFGKDGRSLTLSLKPVDPVRFASATRTGRRTFLLPIAMRAEPPGERGSITIPLDPPLPAEQMPNPPISGARGSNRPLVVIDAGHGGHDPGAISILDQKREKDVTLAVARAVRNELVRSGRVRVALTRDDDRFLALPERVAIARRLKADLFISIHADSAGNGDARGATVYTLSEVASDKEAARLAAKENKADIINGVDLGAENADVQSILIDLAQRETMNVSSSFAALVQRETATLVPFRTDFHRFANFRVLKAPDTPSVLLEIGYLTNIDDARRLYSSEGQKAIATGLRRAIETHFARRIAGQ